jgi:hypothetical protein
MVLAGLPEPRCNITLGTEDRPIGRVDLLLEAYRVILEYEGDHHRTDKWQWNVDISRVEEFTAEGYRVLRVTAAHLQQPRALLKRSTLPSSRVATTVRSRSLRRNGPPCSNELRADAPLSSRAGGFAR